MAAGHGFDNPCSQTFTRRRVPAKKFGLTFVPTTDITYHCYCPQPSCCRSSTSCGHGSPIGCRRCSIAFRQTQFRSCRCRSLRSTCSVSSTLRSMASPSIPSSLGDSRHFWPIWCFTADAAYPPAPGLSLLARYRRGAGACQPAPIAPSYPPWLARHRPIPAARRSTLQWRPDQPFTLDLAEFERWLEEAAAAERTGDRVAMRSALEEAVDLYRATCCSAVTMTGCCSNGNGGASDSSQRWIG